MHRFCFVAIIYCLFVACCLCDDHSGFHERRGNNQQNSVPGSQTDQDPRKPEYRRLAEDSMRKYLKEAADYRYHKVLQVTRVTTQVVSGQITRVYFLAAPTNCLLTGNMTPVNPPCRVGCKDYANLLSCYSEVYEQPWLNRKDINVSCARVNN